MKKFRKLFSVMLAVVIVMQAGALCLASAAGSTSDYKIVSPYEDVIWSGETLPVMVKASYEQVYDFLAISDHGITGVDWNKAPAIQPLYLYQYIIDNPYEHLTDEEYEAITSGTYMNRGKKMTAVLGANEFNNLSLTKNHVNGYFLASDKGNGFPGAENELGYEQAIKYIDDNGGLSHINHPGDWLGSNSNPDIVNDPEKIKFLMRETAQQAMTEFSGITFLCTACPTARTLSASATPMRTTQALSTHHTASL